MESNGVRLIIMIEGDMNAHICEVDDRVVL